MSEIKRHTLKNDRYAKSRGGNSHFLDIHCSSCGSHMLLYQKDGQGSLLRLYLDRILEPSELSSLQFQGGGKVKLPNLYCKKCKALVATPMVYARESRLAFRLVPGSFIKKKSDGTYTPSD
jgi:hypothetical protein